MTTTTSVPVTGPASDRDRGDPGDRVLAPVAVGPLAALCGAYAAVLLALATRYGYHRDELYYVAGGERLDWGFVDHPPVVPLLARAADVLGGQSLLGLRALAVAVSVLTIVVAVLLARELGGGRAAQVLTGVAVVCAPLVRATGLLVGTTGFDMLAWAALLLVVARLLRTGDRRWWVGVGLVAGIALETKWTVLVLIAGLAVGLLADRRWALLRTPWLAAGGLLALALWLPNLVWNAQHDWAFLEFQRAVGEDVSGVGPRIEFVVGQLLMTGITTIVVWWPGLRWLLRDGPGRRFRPLGTAAVVVVLGLLVAGSKMYYSAPVYLALFAAGGVALEAAARGRRRAAHAWCIGALVLSAPMTLPLLPADRLDLVLPVNKELGEMVGWPELVDQVRAARDGLPADERDRSVIVTGNYGEWGAIHRFAPELPVYSGQNSVWWWGTPPDSATSAVFVGLRPARIDELCARSTAVGRVGNAAGIDNEEAGSSIVVCHELRRPWSETWPSLRRAS